MQQPKSEMKNYVMVPHEILEAARNHIATTAEAYRESEQFPDGSIPEDEVREAIEKEERLVTELDKLLDNTAANDALAFVRLINGSVNFDDNFNALLPLDVDLQDDANALDLYDGAGGTHHLTYRPVYLMPPAANASIQLLAELVEVVGDTECRFDHNGFCQEHFVEKDCRVARARAYIKPFAKSNTDARDKTSREKVS